MEECFRVDSQEIQIALGERKAGREGMSSFCGV